MSERYKVSNTTDTYFITNTIMHWIDLFTREIYKEILIDSLRYCQEKKEIKNESRKEWLLKGFQTEVGRLKRVKKFKVWKDGFHLIEIKKDRIDLLLQKIINIHQNPVRAGFVWKAEDYKHSSALDYFGEKGLLDVEVIR